MTKKTGIQRAVDYFEGKPSKLAAALGESVLRQHVEHWLKSGVAPFDRVLAIESVTKGTVNRKDLRPLDWHTTWPDYRPPPATFTRSSGEVVTDQRKPVGEGA